MDFHFLKYAIVSFLTIVMAQHCLHAQNVPDSVLVNYELGEVVIFEEYSFRNKKEEKAYCLLEEDLRVVYPLILIIRSEYQRINTELSLYQGDQEKEFLKWYENYAKESYMHQLSVVNVRQGRLFLKLISRELNYTPYDLIKLYRNKYRAVLWQGTARIFLSNLKTQYQKEDNPMIEHLMKKLDAEYGI